MMNDDAQHERARAAAAAVRTGVSDKVGSLWRSFLLRGVFAIALGVFALFRPSDSLDILMLAVGLYCIADGLTGLIAAIRYPELREQLAQALIVVVLGVVLLLWPGETLRLLLVLLGAAALLAGVGQMLTALRLPADDPERGIILMIGSTAALVGLAVWPGAASPSSLGSSASRRSCWGLCCSPSARVSGSWRCVWILQPVADR
jgi:uncharacterized membrane protein HdeD (DUF308 family)